MGWAWSAYADELAAAALAGLPVCVLMAWVLRRCLGTGTGTGAVDTDAWRSALLDGLLLASVLPFAYATLSHGYGSGRVLSLVPLAELSTSFGAAEVAFSSVTLFNVGGNVALLAGFGALLPLRSRRCASLPRVAVVAVTLSATVEIAQYALDLGRVCSTDDVLLNTLGAVTGALVTRHRWRRRPQPRVPLSEPARQP
ncbi:VanZ family protein [Streptomyces sp. NPDC002644]